VLCIHNDPQIFRKNLGATSKFRALEGSYEASSILRNYNFGVMCEPHCYLAPFAILCEVLHLCVCKETVTGMLTVVTRGTRDPEFDVPVPVNIIVRAYEYYAC
jgi:hypothetical protein